ncbi:MAG: N-acetylneuraminate synthase [Desulfomonile tiedjei]|nr:N-acetylneuraminate synthase [Desulfomonile tiedjei]
MEPVHLGRFAIGPGMPCFIIAEAGVNHNGNLETALRLIDAAVDAGVDAVKFQTFKTERVMSRFAPKAQYQVRTTGEDESQFDMVKRLELSLDDHRQLMAYCRERDILFLSTPFDKESADALEELGVPAFKIPSGEITYLEFVEHIARKRKPLLVSTGMANLGEVEAAVNAAKRAGNEHLVLLHCVSNYPADPRDSNLRAMSCMAEAFKVPIGYSDHTLGIEVALAAVALGACVIEKHFTLDRSMPGPDHGVSLEPDELIDLVQGIRKVEQALGHGRKEPAASEAEIARVARKSLVAARDIPAGTVLTDEMVAVKRPGTGLAPALKPCVLGRTTRWEIAEGDVLGWEMMR